MSEFIVKNILIEILEESGVYIDPQEQEDINLTNFINDSIQFISIIVAIEEKFKIEIPDELLIFDTFNSFKHLTEIVFNIVNTV